MRLLVLHSNGSGYFSAQLRSLNTSSDLLIVARSGTGDAPFDDIWWGLPEVFQRERPLRFLGQVIRFKPDVVLVSGWNDWLYLVLSFVLKLRGAIVVAGMDNQKKRSARQTILLPIAKLILPRLFDYLWVPGKRQRTFGLFLGFAAEKIREGRYCCDGSMFFPESEQRRQSFLFAGRLVPEKGIADLIRAYESYREQVSEPWPLVVVGTGPMAGEVSNVGGIEYRGFVQPADLPAVVNGSTCLVLSSAYEAWGVVVHEAACCGLSLVASDGCGAATDLIDEGVNGYIFRGGDWGDLAAKMLRIHHLTDDERVQFAEQSVRISAAFSLESWRDTLMSLRAGGSRSKRIRVRQSGEQSGVSSWR